MAIRPKSEVERFTPDVHGGMDEVELERLGLQGRTILDFSANINPFGPSPKVREVLTQVDVARYPDPSAMRLRRLIAERHGLSPEEVIVGNGSVEFIRLSALAYLSPGERALIVGPTFGEYRAACALAGAEIGAYYARPEGGFAIDVEELARLIASIKPKLVFLCNPNNPTGFYLERDQVEHLLQASPASLFVLDEAYISFARGAGSSLSPQKYGNLLILRSLTKDYALAGLRLGYALGSQEIIGVLRKVCPPWSTNAFAQAAAVAAFEDEAHLQKSLAAIASAQEAFVASLKVLGLKVIPSRTHFFLVEVGDAKSFRWNLLQKGFMVRDCTSFGLPSFVRIATRRPEENEAFVRAVKELIQDGQ